MADTYYQPEDEWWQPAPDYVPPRNGQPAQITVRANPGQPDGVAGLVNNSMTPAPPQNPLQLLTQGQGEPAPQNALEQRGVIDKLLGLSGPRYQLWPEKMVRSAVTAPGEAYQTGMMTTTDPYGRVTNRQPMFDPETLRATMPVIERALDVGGAAIGGGMPMAVKGALGSAGGKLIQTANEAPAFYSGVERALEGVNQKTATGEQWLNTLRNRPGVKPEELEWTGIDDFLASKAGEKISKDDVVKYMAEHRTEIKEIEKTGKDVDAIIDSDEAFDAAMARTPRRRGESEDAWMDRVYEAAHEVANEPSATKYSQYQLPGGENYRELLLTLPEKQNNNFKTIKSDADHLWRTVGAGENDRFGFSSEAKATEAGNKSLGETPKQYVSSHWDEPNIVAHVRMNDRQIPGVGKSLHLEEVQSDWHQAGKKQGYKGVDEPSVSEVRGFPGQYEVRSKSGEHLAGPFASKQLAEQGWKRMSEISKQNSVPDAPFKSTWADLALKRAISKAAREGYDSISWTPGEQQAARYDLSKQVQSIQAQKVQDGTFHLSYMPKDGNVAKTMGTNVPKDKIAELVGKDLAEKILNQEPNKHIYDGLDLKVGGEGMKAFYDKMLVDKANKLAKSMGGKVEWKKVSNPDEYFAIPPSSHKASIGDPQGAMGMGDPDVVAGRDQLVGIYSDGFWNRNELKSKATKLIDEYSKHSVLTKDGKYHYFDDAKAAQDFIDSHTISVPVLKLTDKMKEAAGVGFPLYMQGLPFSFTPVDYDPFKDNKK